MEDEINVAAKLEKCPKWFELYSPIFGKCKLITTESNHMEGYPIRVKDEYGKFHDFSKDGLYFPLGEVMIFPSKENRDWNKFLPFRINEDNVVIVMEEMKMFFEQIRQEEQRRSVMQEIDEIVDDFNKCIDSILEKLKEGKKG